MVSWAHDEVYTDATGSAYSNGRCSRDQGLAAAADKYQQKPRRYVNDCCVSFGIGSALLVQLFSNVLSAGLITPVLKN